MQGGETVFPEERNHQKTISGKKYDFSITTVACQAADAI